jgi:hypothetical protein
MATRIQVRRGTNTQWNTTDPILNIGEFGYSTTDSQFKIGDGTTIWSELDYVPSATSLGSSLGDYIELIEKSAADGVAELDGSKNILAPAGIIFEGTADAHETTLSVVDPTADRTITLPNTSGTVITTGNLSDITNIGVFSSTITMEGSTANDFELTLSAGDPTADRTITFPDETGTVQLRVTDVSDTEIGYLNGVTSSIQTQLDARVEESLFDAKGDILVASADNTPAKLSVGTNGYILTANTSAATGIEWAAAPIGYSPPTLGSTQIASGATVTTIAGLTLSTPTVSGLTISDGSIVVEGATANEFETTLQFTDPTANRTITLPDATGTVQLRVADVDDAEIGYLNGVTSSIQTQMDLKAPAASPTFTGTVVLPSTVNGPNTTTSVNLLSTSTSANITLGAQQTSGNLTIGGGTQRTTGIVGIGTGATTSGTKTINLGTGSTGGTTEIVIGSSSGATSNITLNGTVTAANNLVITGDLTVNGTTTTINSTTLAVDDKNIVLADGNTSDASADGGGITLSGATSKTFNWVDATDAWTSSEHMNLLTGKSYKINGTAISTALPALTWGDVKNGKSSLVIS